MRYASLAKFVEKNARTIVVPVVAAVRREMPESQRAKAADLRARYLDVLHAMGQWLRRGKFDSRNRAMRSCVKAFVEAEEPTGRVFKAVSEMRRILHEQLHRRRQADWAAFSRDDAATQRFFDLFLEAHATAQEERSRRLVEDAERHHFVFFENMIFPAFLADLEGRFLVINPEMKRFLHLKSSCLLMGHIDHLLGLAEEPKKAVSAYWQKLRAKRRVDRLSLALEIPEKGMRYIELSSTYRKDLRGKVVGLQGFFQDVTRRVLSERLVEEQRRTLQVLFDNVPVGLMFLDREGTISLINKRFPSTVGLHSASRKYTVGRNYDEHLPEMARIYSNPKDFREFAERFLQNPKFRGKKEFELTNGRSIVVHTVPVRSGRGEYVGRIVMKIDVTQQRELERLRDDLTQMIVHDLKNPLSAISMSGKLLGRTLPEEEAEKVGKLLDIIDHSSSAMLRMVMNLLDVSRLEQNRLTLHREPVLIFDLLDALRPNLEAIAEGRELRFPRRRELPPVSLDRQLIQRVLENLLGNAVKHTRSTGTIEIRLRQAAGRFIEISVSDDGEGIRPEDQKTIFEKFGQALHRRRGRNTDTGLGLTFCKLAVEAHGGSIRIRSKVGEGTTFIIRLPRKNSRRQEM